MKTKKYPEKPYYIWQYFCNIYCYVLKRYTVTLFLKNIIC